MSNISGKAYAMNVITPSKSRLTWLNRFLFMLARGQPSNLQGLLGLSLIHFARWVIIKPNQWPDLGQRKQSLQDDYMLFCSNFNGTWDQYIDAFSDGIPRGLDLFWFSARGYPKSIPITPFKKYITHNQINTNYYYSATPGSAQRDIKSSLVAYHEILELEKSFQDLTAQVFYDKYRKLQSTFQGALGEVGYGPVASLATENADRNREHFRHKLKKTLYAQKTIDEKKE